MTFPLNQILLGDCCDLMASLAPASVDFVLTDPPYMVGYRDRSGRSIQGDTDSAWLKPAFRQLFRLLKNDSLCVSFYGWSKTDAFFEAWKSAGFRVVGHIAFPKRYTSTTRLMRYQHESAYLLAKGNPAPSEHLIGDVIEFSYSGNKVHPTQKPLSALSPMIESFCPRGGVVLDPFAGSGSTCLAARMVGRNYLGMEIDPAFHEASCRRLASFMSRLASIVVTPTASDDQAHGERGSSRSEHHEVHEAA